MQRHAEVVQFPVLYPLCPVRTITNGRWVTWCGNELKGKRSICEYHHAMQRSGRHSWDGIELAVNYDPV